MDPLTITVIASLITVCVGAVGKLLYHLRHNIKSCFGINFRSRTNTPESQQPNINMTEIKKDADIQNIHSRERFDAIINSEYVFPEPLNHIRVLEC